MSSNVSNKYAIEHDGAHTFVGAGGHGDWYDNLSDWKQQRKNRRRNLEEKEA